MSASDGRQLVMARHDIVAAKHMTLLPLNTGTLAAYLSAHPHAKQHKNALAEADTAVPAAPSFLPPVVYRTHRRTKLIGCGPNYLRDLVGVARNSKPFVDESTWTSQPF